MSAPWWAGGRIVLAVAAGAGIVLGAARIPDPLVLREPVAAQATAVAAVVPVRSVTLACPGPETEGLASVPAVTGGVSSVLAASAPVAALTGLAAPTEPGSLSITAQPAGTALGSTTARGAVASATLTGAVIAEVTATAALAPGTAALQTWLRTDSDDRGLIATPCLAPRAEHWLLAGGGDSTRRERLVVGNPGANALTVDLELFGDGGRIATVNGSRITVPPHGRTSVLLDALAPGQRSPAVHVTASGGLVTAVVEDSWIEGAVARGRDDVGSGAAPATEVVVPAAVVSGPARVRVLVPGDAEAVVQTRVLTVDGPRAVPVDAVVRVKGGSTRDIDLSTLPAGAYAVQVRADVPVVAAVMVERRAPASEQSDLAWVPASVPITGVGGSPVPGGVVARLVLAGTGAPWSAAVHLVAADGTVSTRTVSGEPDTVALVDLPAAASVWVRPATGTVRAGLSLDLPDAPGGPLVSLVALTPAAVSSTDVPVREVRR